MACRAISMIAFPRVRCMFNIYMFVSPTQVCVVYVVKEVTSSRGLGQSMGVLQKERAIKLYTPAERKVCSLRRNWN